MTKGEVKRIYESVMYQSYLIDLVEDYVKNFETEGDYYFEYASKEYPDGPGVAFDHEPLYDGRYFLEVRFEEDEEDEDEETAVDQAYDEVMEKIKGDRLYEQLIVEKGDGGLWFSLDLNKLYRGCLVTGDIGSKPTAEEFLNSILINSEPTTISAKNCKIERDTFNIDLL